MLVCVSRYVLRDNSVWCVCEPIRVHQIPDSSIAGSYFRSFYNVIIVLILYVLLIYIQYIIYACASLSAPPTLHKRNVTKITVTENTQWKMYYL